MSMAFISDLHLEPTESKRVKVFFQFLDSAIDKYKELYILGDFFEYWIGDDDMQAINKLIMQKLKSATNSGLKIYFIHGNRDFLVGSKFETETGVEILKDQYILNIEDKKIMIAHGDTFCIDDIEYQEMKKEIRSDSWKKDFLAKSIDERINFADSLRAKSKKRNSNKPENIMDVNNEYVLKVIQREKIDILIHGHTHRPAIHKLPNGSIRAVLGSWEKDGWVAEYIRHNIELSSFSM
tara:strand:- start:1028 stop:1741 length:714 start_codon:yes stop_codon:yes gene_type:complete